MPAFSIMVDINFHDAVLHLFTPGLVEFVTDIEPFRTVGRTELDAEFIDILIVSQTLQKGVFH